MIHGGDMNERIAELYKKGYVEIEYSSPDIGNPDVISTYVARYFDPEKFRVSWAIPYETLIRSSSKFGNEKCRTFCLSKPEDIIPSANETKDQFRGAEFAYPLAITSLRKGYFDFDSKVGYLQFNP